jgi:hypothetical protein
MLRIVLFLLGWLVLCASYAQTGEEVASTENDTIPIKYISFTEKTASEYLIRLMEFEGLWRPEGDTMRLSLSRLINHYHQPFDSVVNQLLRFDYQLIDPQLTRIVRSDTLPVKWLSRSVFIVDTVALEKDPYITQKTIVVSAVDSLLYKLIDSIPRVEDREGLKFMIDSMMFVRDTITEVFIDDVYLQSKNIQLHQIKDGEIIPPLLTPDDARAASLLPDSARVLVKETHLAFIARKESPFYKVPGNQMPDSLHFAVRTLLDYTDRRDSILLFVSDTYGRRVPFWLTTEKDDPQRYWVRNIDNDSITIWIGNPSKHEITLELEDDVYVERLEKMVADDIPITTIQPQRLLSTIQPLEEIPVFWSYSMSNAFTLNQTYLSNWAKGGESSLAAMFDIRAGATYTNKQTDRTWENSGRLRYGTLITQEHGFRTNTDRLELNSQYNKVLREKLDFSSVAYFNTQVAKGFKYPNDSVVVSKFLNPGRITVGAGLEYKPFKDFLLNFSVLSYRNTFVLDTANINQRAHGIDLDRRSKQEMGGQLVLKSSVTILDGLNISNTVRLFSNYLEKPQNVDVDWEINLDKRINWYFLVRLNFHFIYDEDIKFPVFDSSNEPVLLPDGSQKRSPMLQLKQFLGLTLSFRL